jgi:O-antigen/teichoic acid export membrane protein
MSVLEREQERLDTGQEGRLLGLGTELASSVDERAVRGDGAGADGLRSTGGSGWGISASVVTAVTVLISLGNYLYSFIVVHLMGAREFSRFSAAQGLMLVLGSGCMAAIPWAMARFIAEREDRRVKQEAMHFGLIASTLQGLVFALVAGTILWLEAGIEVGVMVAISAFLSSLIAVPIGFLQGVDRIQAIALVRVLEFAVRFGSGILILLLVSRSAPAALVGYPIGAVVLIAAGLRLCRSGLPPVSGEADTIRALVRQSGSLGSIQVFLSMLGALDTVAALAAHLGTDRTASYQAAALLGRIPIFLSASIGLAAYVHVVQARTDAEVRDRMGGAVRLYAIVVVPMVITCLTVPDSLLHLLIPSSYADATALLRFTVVSGAAVGWIDVVSTAHQARARFRPAIRILGVAAVAQPIVLILAGRTAGIWVFASALVAVSLVAAILLTVDARHWLMSRVPARTGALIVAALVAAVLLHGIPAAWIALIVLIGAATLTALAAEMRRPPSGPNGTDLAGATALQTEQEEVVEVEPEPVPKVMIIGDSWAAGLGVAESYGKLVAADLGAMEVLDLSAVSKTTGDVLADADRIRAFAPDLAILYNGGTEGLVLPGPMMQRLIERWGPPSWRGLAGLEPRARYSSDPDKRRQQLRSSAVKKVVKRVALKLGGRRRVPLEDYRNNLQALLTVLEEVGCENVFVSMFWIDPSLFPGTPEAMADTQTVLSETLAGRPRTVQVDIHEVLRYWDDFLDDNLHLNEVGHRRVADTLLPAARARLEERWAARSRALI